jgi:hypothetical protein
VDLVQGAHIDDQPAIDLRLTKSSVTLSARRDLDAVAPAKPNHLLDVGNGTWQEDGKRSVEDDFSDVFGVGRDGGRLRRQLSVQRWNVIERFGVRFRDPRALERVKAQNESSTTQSTQYGAA